MYYLILGVVFVAVFAFIAWRIVADAPVTKTPPDDAYICPHCNERHCDCRKNNP
ncbi:MAG: hypothetical protein P8X55_08965 [Desulfosarcinaceae bacterium]